MKHSKPSRSAASDKPISLPVLVIEDDPALLERFCVALESNGYPVIGQSSEAEVVRQLSDWEVAGIVVGTARLKTIATELRQWLSENRPDLEKRAVFLNKPITTEQLLSVVRKSIEPPPKIERILVVDDEEPIREIMALMLGIAGYRCRVAAGGKEALKLLDSGEMFDLVTSDICNSPMDGNTFLEHVQRKFPNIPVLMISAMHDISLALVCLRNGAYDYLVKPFERDQLIFSVRRALECRRLKEENRALQTKIELLGRMRLRD